MFDSRLWAFTVVAFFLTITPGADTMLVLRNALRGGRADGFRTSVGVCSGLFVHATFSALGISIILARSATAFGVVKLVGAAYLVWLGVQSLRRARHRGATVVVPEPGVRRVTVGRSFLEGFLNNILNPKVAIFYLAFLPQFIGPNDPVLAKSLLMAAIHNVMGLVWLGVVASVVDRSRHWIAGSALEQWLGRISGTILVALGIRLALEKR